MHVNFTYIFEDFSGDKVTLSDEERTYSVSVETFNNAFTYTFALTGHSSQGQSMDDAVTIFDATHPRISKKWLYVALTRCRDPEQLYYRYFPETELPTLDVKRVIIEKLKGYIEQDKRAGRTWADEDYITSADVLAMAPMCVHCGQATSFTKHCGTQFTIDRIDNTRPHIKTNVQVACLDCNRRRK